MAYMALVAALLLLFVAGVTVQLLRTGAVPNAVPSTTEERTHFEIEAARWQKQY